MQELRDKTPFHCIITGSTNCGKKQYLIEQLRGPFKYVFVLLICPTYSKNKTYHGFAENDKNIIVGYPDASNCDEINDLLHECADLFSDFGWLCCIERLEEALEQVYQFRILWEAWRLIRLGINSAIDLHSQTFRENVACVVAFHNPSQIGTKTLFEDYGGDLDADTRKKFAELLKSERYSRVCFRLKYPFHCYLEVPAIQI